MAKFEPHEDHIRQHLEHLFGGYLDGAQHGRIEIAWTDPIGGRLNQARWFGTNELDEAAEFAVETNRQEGKNTYVGAALRKPDTAPFGRADDEDFYCLTAFYADLDDADAVRGARERYKHCPPTAAVWTGKTPGPRQQLWWRLELPEYDPGQCRAQNRALAEILKGDTTVINASRVMRLAGTIAWPTKPGRVKELTEFVRFNDARARVYIKEQLARAFPPRQNPVSAPEHKSNGLDLGLGVDPVAMLRAAKPGKWHNSMLAFTAHCVSTGCPDWIIIEAARQILDDPTDPSDIVKLIETARDKWKIADPGVTEIGPLAVVGVRSFLEMDLPPRETVFGSWFPVQGLVMVYSERGIGKTYFALNVAHAIATAGVYLDWHAPKQRRVLYLDGEMPAPTMQERARAIAGFNPPNNLDDWFRLVTPDLQEHGMPDISTKEGQARLEPHLADVDVVVIDNLSTLCRTGVENEAESWLPVQGWLLELRRYGMSVLVVHHAGKGGKQRGTSRREDVLDSVMVLRRPSDYEPQEGARFEIHFEKSRGFTGDDAKAIEAKLETDNLGRATWKALALEDKLAAQIWELHEQELSIREIAKELSVSKSTVQRRLSA